MALKHLIIGCGSAAVSAAEQIRTINADDDIHVVTMEDADPYSPTALPYLLSGKTDEAGLFKGREGYFGNLNCRFLKAKEVVEIYPDKKEVGYRGGEKEHYDKLLIASGSSPVAPPIEGLAEYGFLGIRTLEDCKKLLGLLEKDSGVAVLGGGLVGVEVAIGLAEKGYRVTIIEKEPRLLPLYFDKDAEGIIRKAFLEHNINLLTGMEVRGVHGKNGGVEIAFSDGGMISANVLVTCVGVRANVDFLKGTGIKIGRGIRVDRAMRTSVEDIYAAGDVVEAPDFFNATYGMNPIILSAVAQGRVAGSNMAGVPETYRGWTSSNIFTFFGNTAFSVGLSMPAEEGFEVVTKRDDHRGKYKKLVFDQGRLVGASMINTVVDPGVLLCLIEKGIDVGKEKALLFEQPGIISQRIMLENEKKC